MGEPQHKAGQRAVAYLGLVQPATLEARPGAQVGRWFAFKQRKAKLTTELRAGLVTFLMASAAAPPPPRRRRRHVGAAAGVR